MILVRFVVMHKRMVFTVTFFDIFTKLCVEKGVSVARAAADMGLSNSTTTKWAKGAFPSGRTLQKVAQYFGVTTDWLLSQCAEDGVEGGGNIIGSAVIQGSLGSSIKYNTNGEERSEASEQETELLRIFRGLDMKGKIAVLSFAYAEEERQNTK